MIAEHPPTDSRRSSAEGFARVAAVTRRRVRPATAAFLGIFAAVVLVAFAGPRTYTTESEVLLHRSAPRLTSDRLSPLRDLSASDAPTSNETFVALARRYRVAEKVTKELRLEVDPAILLDRHVVVSPLTNTDVLRIAVTWSDADTSARIANAFAAAFIEAQRELNVERVDTAVRDARRAMETAQRDVVTTHAALAGFEAAHEIADVGAQTSSLVTRWNDLQAKIGERSVDRRDAAARLLSVRRALARSRSTIPSQTTVQPNAARAQLEVQLVQSEAQLAAAQRQFTDAYPTVAPLKEQVEKIRRAIRALPVDDVARTSVVNPETQRLRSEASTLQAQVEGDAAAIGQLRAEGDALLSQIRALPHLSGEVSRLVQRAKAADDALTALRDAYYDALVARTVAPAGASLVQSARAALARPKPSRLFVLAVGLVVALLAAIGLVLALDRFDDTVKDGEDVAREGLPFLGVFDVPRGVDDLSGLQGPVRRAALRLRLALSRHGEGVARSTAFTAPDGDTASSGAMAVALAVELASSGRSTVLVDADLRGGRLGKCFGVPDAPGLGDALLDETDGTSYLVETATGVKLLPAGREVDDEFGALPGIARIIAQLRERYDAVIVESRSCDVTAGLVATGAVDAAVLVATPGSTSLRETREAAEALGEAGKGFAGVLLRGSLGGRPSSGVHHAFTQPALQRLGK